MKLIKTYLAGFFIGIANVIPGVSGGTMAVVFGVYEMMIEVLSLNFKNLKQYILPLVILFTGIVTGIFGFAQVMGFLLENYTALTYTVFVGIILGSFPLILKLSRFKEFKRGNMAAFIVTTLLVSMMIVFQDRTLGDVDVSVLNLNTIVGLLVASSLSTITMIIPGVSGSMLLVMIGYYTAIFSTIIGGFLFPHLAIVGVGMVVGLVVGSKLMSVLLKKHEKLVYHIILGLIVGSTWSIVPAWNQPLLQSILLAGAAVSIYIINK